MIKRDKKKKLRMIYTSELKLLEERYEKMAAEGWMIENVTGAFDKFQKCQPAELDFSVTLFQAELPVDYPNKDKHDLYQEFCEDSGWKHVCHNNLFHVYCKSKDNHVVAIHTDAKSEYSSLFKGFLRSEAMLIVLLMLQIFQLMMHVNFLSYRDFMDSQLTFNFLTPLVLSGMLLICLLPSVRFIIRNHFRVKKGETILYDSLKVIKRNNRIRLSSMIFCTLYLILTFANIIFRGVPTYILITVILTQACMWGVFYLFFLKVKKIKHSRLVNTIILIALFFITWIGSVVIMFSVVGSHLDFERPVYDMPDVSILNYEDLGYDYAFEPELDQVESTLLVPLSFNYLARHENKDDYIYLEVEYIQTKYAWVKDMMIPLIFDYNYRHSDEVKPDIDASVIDYEDVKVYKIRPDQSRILVINEEVMYIVTMNQAIKDDLLVHVVGGLID
ncbi:DUF2812 domain-containing protein [Acidaminobacter sp. JC074]|uniref:DUF2812 domain-containing protein n=1 Tax=Acidaminobacter sp. JC074 TaxID=2530199 RepID=UPI001F0E6B14|nr:DUF2812 domain-containing protein [Acidaminobacter sp. JC074]MCH4888055.1 DUF2812 domain-containing protein [Acidaminobacter sp. JC074]